MTDLKPKQLEVAVLLATGETISSAAIKAAVSRSVVHEWLRDCAFVAHLNGLKHEIIDSSIARIQNATTLALDTVLDIMQKSKNDSVRMAAAKSILEATHTLERAQTLGATSVFELEKNDREHKRFEESYQRQYRD